MTLHELDATETSVTDVFDRDQRCVLTIDPGDTVIVRSLDASGYTQRQQVPGQPCPRLIPDARGHCLTGPIEVRGAEPGAVLAIELTTMDPGAWGWTVAGARDTPLNRRLGIGDEPPSWLLWDLQWDPATGTGTGAETRGHRIPLAPFLGVIGVPPAEPGAHSTIPPRIHGGGNIDCRSLVAGSTLYLPVTVPGARLLVGDGHAAQGDGEVSGTAVECAMTTTMTIDLLPARPIGGIHARTPSGWLTFGFHADLNEAMAQALSAILDWLQAVHHLDRPSALALASPVVDLRVTQVANDTWGVHALLPHDALTGA